MNQAPQQYKIVSTEGLSSDEAMRVHRMNSLGSLYYFIKVALRRKKLTPALHLPMTRSVERTRLKDVKEYPRDHFKSTIFSEGLPMWWALPFTVDDQNMFLKAGYSDEFIRFMLRVHNPNTRTCLVSENLTNATKLGNRVRWHFESNTVFRTLFPEIMPTTSQIWTNTSLHVRRTGTGGVQGEGTFDFLGVGGALQSRHYDRIVQDDLVGRKAIESASIMDKTIDYHRLLIGAYESDDETHENDELVVGNRWAYTDLNSWIKENEPWFGFETHGALGGCCDAHQPDIPIFPEMFSASKLAKFKSRLGAYLYSCFPAGINVLLADLTEKPIEQLKVGDEIVGYKQTNRWCLTKAVVQAVNTRKAPVIKAHLASGRVVFCTPEHKWFVSNGQHRERENYKPLSVGMELCSVYDPFDSPNVNEQRDLDWLGGILDGEGSCNVSGQVFVSQHRLVNPDVHSEIVKVLDRLKIKFQWDESSQQFRLNGARSLKIRLVSHAKMAKKQRFLDGFWKRRRRIAEYYDRVVKIEEVCEMDVYNIQSSTGNYIAAGFATKNCQFLNNPCAPEDADFSRDWLRYYTTTTDPNNRVVLQHEVANGVVLKDTYHGNLSITMAVDPNHAGNAAAGRCRHAIVVVGFDGVANYYLLDYWARHGSYDTFIDNIYAMGRRWGLRSAGVESVAAQKYLIYHIEKRNQLEFNPLKIIPLKGEVDNPDGTVSRNKEWRIRNVLSPIFERGNFWIKDTQQEFINEYQTFPRGQFVDILDALAYCPQLLKHAVPYEKHMSMLNKNRMGVRQVGRPYAVGA